VAACCFVFTRKSCSREEVFVRFPGADVAGEDVGDPTKAPPTPLGDVTGDRGESGESGVFSSPRWRLPPSEVPGVSGVSGEEEEEEEELNSERASFFVSSVPHFS
jgi:hypothetical protein